MASLDDRLRAVFRFYDEDGNGHVDDNDFLIAYARMLDASGLTHDSAAGQALWSTMEAHCRQVMAMDADGDGEISWEEFRDWHLADLHGSGPIARPRPWLIRFARNIFWAFDADGDGLFGREDLARLAESRGWESGPDLDARFTNMAQRYGDGDALDIDGWIVFWIDLLCAPQEDVPTLLPV